MTKYIDWGNAVAPKTVTVNGLQYNISALPIMLAAIIEDIVLAKDNGVFVDSVRIRAQDVRQMRRRRWLNGYAQLLDDTPLRIFGVPAKITKGRDPYYIMTNEGRLH